MANGVFDLEEISVNLIIDGAPIDVSSGLTIDADFLKISKESQDEVKTRKGTKDESYSANSVKDNIRIVEMTYIPSSSAVVILQGLRESRTPFGIFIKNSSSPKFVFSATNCVVQSEPETVIHGKDGFKDYTFKVKCLDSNQVWA